MLTTSTATPTAAPTLASMANTAAALDRAKNAKKAMTSEKARAILTVILKELPTSDEGRKAIEADLVLLGVNASVKAIFGLINRANALVDPTYAARVTLVDRQLGEARVWAKYNWYVDKFNARFLTPKVEGKGEVGFLVHVVRQVEASIKIFGERDLVKKPLTKDERKLVQLALKNGRALINALRHPAQDERQKKFGGRGRRFDKAPRTAADDAAAMSIVEVESILEEVNADCASYGKPVGRVPRRNKKWVANKSYA